MALTAARRLLLAAALALALAGSLTSSVAAHGGGAVFEVLEVDESAPGRVAVRLRITHEADGHPAEGAIVDAVPMRPGGAAGEAVRVDRQDEPGVYAAVLEVPDADGVVLAVTSSFPEGSTEVPLATAGEEATTTTARAEDPGLEEREAGGAEGGSDTSNLLAALVFGVLGGALGLWVSKRRSARRRAAQGG